MQEKLRGLDRLPYSHTFHSPYDILPALVDQVTFLGTCDIEIAYKPDLQKPSVPALPKSSRLAGSLTLSALCLHVEPRFTIPITLSNWLGTNASSDRHDLP